MNWDVIRNQNHGEKGWNSYTPTEFDQGLEYAPKRARDAVRERMLRSEEIAKKARNLKIFKVITAIVIAGTLAGTVSVSAMQHENFKEATDTNQTIDLPNEVYNDYDLTIQNNGQAFFYDSNGNRISNYNGQSAQDIASSMQNSGPVR